MTARLLNLVCHTGCCVHRKGVMKVIQSTVELSFTVIVFGAKVRDQSKS